VAATAAWNWMTATFAVEGAGGAVVLGAAAPAGAWPAAATAAARHNDRADNDKHFMRIENSFEVPRNR
jgi:hypothetical protein